MRKDGMPRDRMGKDGMPRDRMGKDGTSRDRMRKDDTPRDRMRKDSAPRDRVRKETIPHEREKRPDDRTRRDPAEEEELSTRLEGRNAVREAFRAGRTIDKLYVLDGCMDEPVQRILAEARKTGCVISFMTREQLDRMSETGTHQGVIAQAAAVDYADTEEMLRIARERGEDPLLFVLDGIEDPHNLGAIIRTADAAGAHGVVIPKRHAATVTAACARASAGAVNCVKIARVPNLAAELDRLKEAGLWVVGADMDGQRMYDLDLTGPCALVIGNEGSGIRRLIREKCDHLASIPMGGQIGSLNASVAAGVLAYEVVRQRIRKVK